MDKIKLLDELLLFGKEEVIVIDIVENMKICEVIVKKDKRKFYAGFEELQKPKKKSLIERFFKW